MTPRGRWLNLASCILVAAAWIGWFVAARAAYSPLPPRGAEIPSTEFSATRAGVLLEQLVGDGIPHPAGSEQNAVVRRRIVQRLEEFGYEPEVQSTQVERYARHITLQNVIARRRGTLPGQAILLAAHFDSVAAGPGASDDGAGVAAILEIARMLKDAPPARNDVIFLFTDGEEEGMLGAKGFVREHPWAKDIRVAINLEARGTSGQSLLFETSEADAWLIALYSQYVTHPATSSLYYEVYRRLTFNTDFTVFKQRGIEGYNFAYIRNPQDYHSARDDYAHADLGSLQHHGDNAWQLLSVLLDFNLEKRASGRAIYTDVLGKRMLWWPASINFALAVGVLAATCVATAIARRRGFLARNWRAVAATPLAVLAMLMAGKLCNDCFRHAGVFDDGWVDNPAPILATYCGLAMLAVFGCYWLIQRRAVDGWCAWAGVWLWWNSMGLVAAWLMPGASYLFLIPGAVAAALGLVASLLPRKSVKLGLLTANFAEAIVAGLFWVPLTILLYDALGVSVGIAFSVVAGLLATSAAPLLNFPGLPLDPGYRSTPD